MQIHQEILQISTPYRGMVNITAKVAACVKNAEIITGTCHVFLHHTSASLLLCENSDFAVQQDLETFMSKLVPDDMSLFTHVAEGHDDMPSHIRSVLTQNSITVPITKKKLALGTWQGIFLWEHRLEPHERKITITAQGSGDA